MSHLRLSSTDSWRTARYNHGFSDKKSALTARIPNHSNLLSSLLCHAQTPTKVVFSRSADNAATSALCHSRVDALCALPRAQNTFPGDFLLVRHDSLTSAVCFSCLHRPVHGTERVTPDAWHIYRKNHQFLGPCCLCPLLQPLSQEPRYTEAAIYLPLRGRYKGEWVAECAEGRCGYLGRSSSSPKPNCSYTPLLSPFREGVCQVRASSEEIRRQR